MNVGTHPTAPGGPPTIEANLLDYDGGALYDRHMRLFAVQLVRSEKKFDSLEQLRAEVMKNREQVRAYLSGISKDEKIIKTTEVLFTKRNFRVTISFGLNRTRR